MFRPEKLEKVPDQSELHFWADYVELRCLADPDGEFSVNALIQQMGFADDLGETDSDAQDADDFDIQDLVGELSLAEGVEVDDTDLPDVIDDERQAADEGAVAAEYSDYGRASERRDDRRRWTEDVYRVLASRASLLGATYPFRLSEDSTSIERLDLSDGRLVYVFYLACSSLRCVDGATQSRLTSVFELVSADVFSCLLPDQAIVDVFGTARGMATSMFTGTLFERIGLLAAELRGKVIVDQVDFHPSDTADNGLDLVAWLPMDDDQPGVPSFFAQCACGTDWKGKQSEASYTQRWCNFIHLTSPATTLTFIPHFFRKAGGHWNADSDVETVLVDRLRALRAYERDDTAMAAVPFDLARRAWDFRLATV